MKDIDLIKDKKLKYKVIKYSFKSYKKRHLTSRINEKSFKEYLKRNFILLFLWDDTKEGSSYWTKFDTHLNTLKRNLKKMKTNRSKAIEYWNTLDSNPLVKKIKQNELIKKYYGKTFKAIFLTGNAIEHIYNSENIINKNKIINKNNIIDDKINQLLSLSDEFIFPAYYPHEKKIMWKISNVYTEYGRSEVLVLSGVDEGIEIALDLAIKYISEARDKFYN